MGWSQDMDAKIAWMIADPIGYFEAARKKYRRGCVIDRWTKKPKFKIA